MVTPPIRKITDRLEQLRLNTKLLLMMLSLLFLSLMVSFAFYWLTEKAVIKEIMADTADLTTAIQISVEQLTTQGNTDEARLRDYVNRLNKKGVKEISVLSNENKVIASSNPHRNDRSADPRRRDLVITEKIGEDLGPKKGQKPYNILVPIVVAGEQLGYVHIIMMMDDFSHLLRANFFKRLAVHIAIFSVGILLSFYLARRYTRPIKQVVEAAKNVAAGDLSKSLVVQEGGEIGELTRSFNEMVEKLRLQKSLEGRLRHAEHLSAVGQLASGIAHEIRNPLNLINLSIDHLRTQMERAQSLDKEEIDKLMVNIKAEIHRLNQMIENFLDFGKPLRLQIQSADLASILSEVLQLALRKGMDQGVAFETTGIENLPRVLVDVGQIKNCFFNITLNALQAMSHGGVLKISAQLDDQNNRVWVRFEDNGCGIEADHLQKIFEPYFTTKKLGIGLGLALTKRIVEEHGGSISVTSQSGAGTRITLALPLEGVPA
ncbi:MAG: HAMP domain-containing protein [Nitrospirae bacterium]|nr:HAMP domain-containing protein [Nitrospirota bacterium]